MFYPFRCTVRFHQSIVMADDGNSSLVVYCANFGPDYPVEVRLIAYEIVIPIIIASGFLLNSISLFTIHFSSTIKGVSLLYLSCLTWSNWILMIFCVPWIIGRTSNKCKTGSSIFYHSYIEAALLNSTATFSLYVLTCMSVERYFSVVHPTYFHRIHRMNRARIALVVSALISLIIQVPTFLNFVPSECCQIANISVTTTPYWRAYLWVNQIFSRFLPSIALIYLNVRMMAKYRRVIKKRGQMTAGSSSQLNTPSNSILRLNQLNSKSTVPLPGPNPDEKRMLVLLTGVVVLVVICIIPAGIAILLPQLHIFDAVADILELFHYAIVSFVFCLCNNDIQRRLRLMITCNSSSSSSRITRQF